MCPLLTTARCGDLLATVSMCDVSAAARTAPHRPAPARPPLPRSRHTAEWPGCTNTTTTRATTFTSQTGKIFLQKHRQVHFLHLFQRGWGPRPRQPGRSLGWTSFTLHRIGAPPPSPRAAVCRVNKSLIYLRADFQRRAELRITKYFPHMGPGRLGWRRGSGRPGNLKLSQINLNPNEAWRQRRTKISFRNTFEEIKSSQKNHLPFCLRVVQQRPARSPAGL